MGYHGHMQKIAVIDVLGDEALQARIMALSLVLMGATAVAAVLVGLICGLGEVTWPWWWLGLAAGCLVPLPVHELVHAACFKLLCPGCRVSFGVQGAFLYTRTDGVVATRGRMVAVLVAPALLVTGCVLAASLVAGSPVLAVLLAGIHLSGCAGDLIMAAASLREPRCTHVRDTETGIDLLFCPRDGSR